MDILIYRKAFYSLIRLSVVLSLLIIPGVFIWASTENEPVTISNDIKIKRASGDTVCLIAHNDSGEFEEFFFTDFNADVVLMIYRKVDMEMLIKNLSKKYYLSKTDARRYVKMTINTLEQWGLVKRF